MGGLLSKSTATNEINSMVNASISILNQMTQNCYTNAANVQGLSFRNIKGNIDIENLNWNQMIVANSACIASQAASNEAKQAVSQQLSQAATALVGALSLGQSDANNLINAAVDMSQHIINAFAQTCQSTASNSQTIQFDGVVGNITIGYTSQIAWTQSIQAATQCVQNAVAQTTSAQTIKQIIDQTASAKNAGLLDFLKYGMIFIVLVIGLVVIGGVVLLPKILGAGGGGTTLQTLLPATAMAATAVPAAPKKP
jgi:hypothetical protein